MAPGRRLTVVCLHGLSRTPSDWDGVGSGLERFGPVQAPHLPHDPAAALAVAEAAVEPGAVVVGHSMGGVLALRLARERRPRALILTSCFFPPARNGRSIGATVADYARHRVAFVRAAASRENWAVNVLDYGGHHPHVDDPARWLAAAVPWLERQRTP